MDSLADIWLLTGVLSSLLFGAGDSLVASVRWLVGSMVESVWIRDENIGFDSPVEDPMGRTMWLISGLCVIHSHFVTGPCAWLLADCDIYLFPCLLCSGL